MSAAAELEKILNRLSQGEIDLATAVDAVQRMDKRGGPPSRQGRPRGPRNTYEQVMADPDGGEVPDSLGNILSSAFVNGEITDEQFDELVKLL